MIRGPTARLFVAVDPPQDVAGALASWARNTARTVDCGAHPSGIVRVLDPELLHVTLCFLGNRPVGELDSLAAQLGACEGSVGELALGAPLWLPRRRPRVLAVELHDDGGELKRLQREVVAALAEVSSWQLDAGSSGNAGVAATRRHFHPHITVARIGGRGAPGIERALAPTPSRSFAPSELILYRSWLSPEGASYEAVASRSIG